MTAGDRSRSTLGLSSSSASASRSGSETQSATFDIGKLRLELSASPGAARLVVMGNGARDTYVVDPSVLARWAALTKKLLSLQPTGRESERVEFRAPFLFDREGRTSIAFEGLLSAQGVNYRLLVAGATDKIAGLMTTRDVVEGVVEAALGTASVAQRAS